MKGRKIALIIGIVLAGGICFLPARSFADLIYLKNGRILEGEVVGQTDGYRQEGYIEVRLRSAKVRLNMSEVESIEKKPIETSVQAEGYSDSEPAPAQKTEQKTEQKPAQKPEEKPSYKITVSAVYNNDFEKEIIIVYGKTNLPDKSPVNVKLKTKDGLVGSCQTLVKKKQFNIGFGPFKQKLDPASYSIEAEYKSAEGEIVTGSCTIRIGLK